jgi:hypothetical protein
MAFKFSAENKKWITVVAMVILAAYSITSPIDLKGMLPAWVSSPTIGSFSLVNIASYLVLVGAYWIFQKEI